MLKNPNIKWRDSDNKKLAEEVRKFNAKRTRLIKKLPEMVDFLPEKLSVKELREQITTRKDFNREIKSIERFMIKGSEKPIISQTGIKTTEWEKKEIALKVRRINLQRKRELEQAAPSTEKGTMGSVRANNLQPKKFDIDKIKKSDWEKFVESVEKQSRANYQGEKMQKYKENYLRAILDNLGEAGKELFEYVSRLDAAFIYNNYYDDPILQIGFTSDPLPVETIAESALEHWQAVAETADE